MSTLGRKLSQTFHLFHSSRQNLIWSQSLEFSSTRLTGKQMSINKEVVPLFIPSPFPGHLQVFELMGNDQHPDSQAWDSKSSQCWFQGTVRGLFPASNSRTSQLTLYPRWTSSSYSQCHGVFSPLCLCSHYFLYLNVSPQFLPVETDLPSSGQKYLLHEVSSNSQMLRFCSPFNPVRLHPI